jgi:hypothetical protein
MFTRVTKFYFALRSSRHHNLPMKHKQNGASPGELACPHLRDHPTRPVEAKDFFSGITLYQFCTLHPEVCIFFGRLQRQAERKSSRFCPDRNHHSSFLPHDMTPSNLDIAGISSKSLEIPHIPPKHIPECRLYPPGLNHALPGLLSAVHIFYWHAGGTHRFSKIPVPLGRWSPGDLIKKATATSSAYAWPCS